MKLKNSTGIAMKLICCTALVVLASAFALSQTPKSGALLTIQSTDGTVNLKIYDSQIHTGTVRTVPLGTKANGGNCVSADQIPTDAYVLQGGAPTGCDPGDDFETAKGAGVTGTATLGNFLITTNYLCAAKSCGSKSNSTSCESVGNVRSDNTGLVCISGTTKGASVDTGFLTVKNTGADFTGTITLRGASGLVGGFCPAAASVTDSSNGTLTAGNSQTFALSQDSSDCGGFNAPQTLNLAAGQTSIASFGNDDYQITPLNTAGGDQLQVLPVPVPAGPLGLDTWGLGKFGSETPVVSSLRFSATNFAGDACVPYADFSAPGNPVCVELQLHCTGVDCSNLLYTAQTDYAIDGDSLPNGVGGPAFLGRHTVDCPTTGFNFDIFLSYTAPPIDPLKGGGSGTGSCFVAAFDPTAQVVTTGNSVTSFVGFASPVSNTQINFVNAGSAVGLIWQSLTATEVPVTTLTLCGNPNGTGCTAPWVLVQTTPINCPGITNTQTDLTNADPGKSGLQNFGNGSYQFNLQTKKGSTGCFAAVLTFNSGLVVFPARFEYQ